MDDLNAVAEKALRSALLESTAFCFEELEAHKDMLVDGWFSPASVAKEIVRAILNEQARQAQAETESVK